MPINVKSVADFWARIKGDTATAGDGSSNTQPARFDHFNSDLIDVTTTGSITAADSGSSTATGAGGQSIVTGTPTTNSFISATLNACSTVTLQVTGTFTGTIVFERSVDGGTTWTASSLVIAGVGSIISSTTTIGVFRGNVAGATNFRARATAMSGTASIAIVAGKGIENVFVGNGVRSAAYTSTDASGTTSGTVNTYTQLSAAGVASRAHVRIYNPEVTSAGATNTTNLTVGVGASASETTYRHLSPGDEIIYSGSDRVAIKSILSTSAIYICTIATYS